MLSPGARIYECRLSKKMSQAELAQRAGLAQANLSNIEKGKRDLTVSTLIRIASALEIKPSRLIDPEVPSKPPVFTRDKIEKLAESVLDPGVLAPRGLQKLAVLFRQILPDKNLRASEKKINLAWEQLRQRLPENKIKGILSRVEDARQRVYAKKAD